MQILDGKLTAEKIKEELKIQVEKHVQNGGKRPNLVAVIVGNDGASKTYVDAKAKACIASGFDTDTLRFEETITETELLHVIDKLNNDDNVDGYIVQLPLPKHIDAEKVLSAVSPLKDVDGFHPENVGKMTLNLTTFLPATPYGIMLLLEKYGIETKGKHCVVIGRSNIVGTPMSILMLRKGNATVTTTHVHTVNLKNHTLMADILIVAVGKPNFITADMVKEGAIVIDVGITRIDDASKKSGFRLIGDVNYDEVAPKCSWITPVPGGVGPMTIAGLMKNTFLAAQKKSLITA